MIQSMAVHLRIAQGSHTQRPPFPPRPTPRAPSRTRFHVNGWGLPYAAAMVLDYCCALVCASLCTRCLHLALCGRCHRCLRCQRYRHRYHGRKLAFALVLPLCYHLVSPLAVPPSLHRWRAPLVVPFYYTPRHNPLLYPLVLLTQVGAKLVFPLLFPYALT